MNTDSIDDVLGQDHERLGALLDRCRRAILASSSESRQILQSLSRDLLHHMKWEEERLFPAVAERATSAQRRSIESLEIDHERLRETLGELEAAVAVSDFGTAAQRMDWLGTLLQGHNYDEEHGVYVEADGYLTLEARRRMIEAFRTGAT